MIRSPKNIDEEVDLLKVMIDEPVDSSVLKDELLRYHNRYRMDIEASKKAVLRDHGKRPMVSARTVEMEKKTISEIKDKDSNFELTAMVFDVSTKTTNTKNGPAELVKIGIADNTGLSSVTVWEPDDYPEIGTVYRFTDCYVKEYNGILSINLGNRGRYAIVDETQMNSAIIDKIIDEAMDIDDVQSGMTGVTVRFIVDTLFTDEVETRKGPSEIYSGIAKGRNKKLKFSSWSDHLLEEGKEVCLSNVTVNGFNNQLKITIDDSSLVIRVD